MKNLLFIICFILISCNFSTIAQTPQVSDLGKMNFNEVLNSFDVEPCEKQKEVITYCYEGGNKMSYLFENNILHGIISWTAFTSKYLAERELEKKVSEFESKNDIIGFKQNGKILFSLPNSLIVFSFGVAEYNNTAYLGEYVFLKPK
tara:strand:+ start:43 stop:483 length:441 start_codon:yes stop_codon:yes gene_type:complete